MNYFFS